MNWKNPWYALTLVFVVSFAVLLYAGKRIAEEAPPIPSQTLTNSGEVVIDHGVIERGQNVWQAMGGMELGSIWGHGSYTAPDWTADYLHREAVLLLDRHARHEGSDSYESSPLELAAALRARLQAELRHAHTDESTGVLTISEGRAAAFRTLEAHYTDVFTRGRADYAIPAGALADADKLHALTAFFFWSSWASVTDRPSTPGISYTSNWPHEPLVENRITGESMIWTGVSIIVLLAGITGLVWWRQTTRDQHTGPITPPPDDPLLAAVLTRSQKVTLVYFAVVSLLFLAQIIMGVITAHYGVEGNGFYGIDIAGYLPYVVTRTWHTQLGIFWIATAWLAAGLFVAPSIGDGDPPYQTTGVVVLLGALVVVVFGSMAGQWLSVMHHFSDDVLRFYFGHSGYEYIDLGRAFQIGLFVGLILWVSLVLRAVWPALWRKPNETRGLLVLFILSSLAIAGFYGAALGYGHQTHLSVAEYWRWWVVHLWVEGFFEVFATAVFAFLFARLGLLEPKSTERAVVAASAIFLSGGIIGTLHHLYYSGTPQMISAWGSVFSALEVVPLVLIGHEAWEHTQLSRNQGWVRKYRYPIYFFLSVAFWNAIGAGLFGFMINPPVALYYMQGLNTTPVHAHAALFGVYGMLGLALMLFCLRAAAPDRVWNETALRWSFWLLNIGLFAMVVISLLPVGLLQTKASVEIGYWYARSAEFLQTPLMNTFRWLRLIGDTLFAAGAVIFSYFMVTLLRPK